MLVKRERRHATLDIFNNILAIIQPDGLTHVVGLQTIASQIKEGMSEPAILRSAIHSAVFTHASKAEAQVNTDAGSRIKVIERERDAALFSMGQKTDTQYERLALLIST